MKTKFLISFLCLGILLCFANSTSFAQSAPKFGKVEDEEVKMTSYPKDPEASAVILTDYGRTYFKYSQTSDFQIVFVHYKKVKILKKDAYKLADIEIPLYYASADNREKVADLKGFTYNYQDGKVEKTKLEKDAIFDSKESNNWQYKKFVMPNVKEGSVIEYQYEVISDFLFNLPVWKFQDFYPTEYSEYVTEIPEYFNYVSNSQSYMPFTEHTKEEKNGSITLALKDRGEGVVTRTNTEYHKLDYRVNTNRWVMKDVPAFKNEKFITSIRDCINLIEFQLASYQYPQAPLRPVMDSWEKLVENLLKREEYGGYIEKRSPIKDLVAKLIEGKTAAKDKMTAIYEYVKNNIKYNDDDGIYTEIKMKDVLEKKTGGSAEINLLLVAMLKEAGLEAYPILLSTRNHGKINVNYPILSKFNYNIAYVAFDEEEHLLDATDPMRPVDMLPAYALSETGLLIMKGGQFGWANLLNRYKSTELIYTKLDLLPDGTLKGEINQTLTGYAALDARKKLGKQEKKEKTSENEGEEKEEKEDIKENKVVFTYENLSEYDKPLKGKATYQGDEFAETGGDRIYLNPMLSYKWKENPFKLEERNFPVDFAFPFEYSYFMNFTIPEGYVVEEMPKSTRNIFGDKTVKFDYLISNQTANLIQVNCKLTVSRALFQAEEYKDLKNFFAGIVAKQNEQIVLKKK
ncbi:DUF3857 domain-containing protein [Thermoflexibacter ruber]|uniref:Transglutaminase-like superfamily protein n=1 Tax=Thermoflexibacter ruber TaxID=1003 RepID=A0A1I2JYU7_9BACT|nr:DUF3857 domain-containing protein [Thermoflexibacter ruber]SFF58097.1 Transglutaminase-like superfamily protein [Thermoflexibacter ruber]